MVAQKGTGFCPFFFSVSLQVAHELEYFVTPGRQGFVAEVGVEDEVFFGGDFVEGGELGRRRADGVG